MSNLIDAVIVDTSAIVEEQCDFMGLNSATVPSFFDLLDEKGIMLLNHPIIFGEVIKHITESEVVKKADGIQKAILRHKSVLPLVGISPEEIIEKLESLNLCATVTTAFEAVYQRAIMLPYPKPEDVFTLYFSGTPPFSVTGNKKNEFPDAFVIEAVKQYINAKPYASILAISKDQDWKSALSNVPRVSIVESLDQGIKLLQSAESILPIFHMVEDDIKKAIEFSASCECYDIPKYELKDDIEIDSVHVADLNDNIIPLKITDSSVLLKCIATLNVSGRATVLDEDRSFWDKEVGAYLFVAYSNMAFKNAVAKVECEIDLAFDSEDIKGTVDVKNVKLNIRFDINIDTSNADVTWIEQNPAEDAYADMMDTLEDRYRH